MCQFVIGYCFDSIRLLLLVWFFFIRLSIIIHVHICVITLLSAKVIFRSMDVFDIVSVRGAHAIPQPTIWSVPPSKLKWQTLCRIINIIVVVKINYGQVYFITHCSDAFRSVSRPPSRFRSFVQNVPHFVGAFFFLALSTPYRNSEWMLLYTIFTCT